MKGSRFTFGGLGVEVCSLDAVLVFATVRKLLQPLATVHNRLQPLATACNRLQPLATACNRPRAIVLAYSCRAYGQFCTRGHFSSFPALRSCVSRGNRGTTWHVDVFRNVSRIVLRGKRNTFATLSQDALHFSWQAQHFGRVQLHLAWQAQHFRRVVLPVFCESHCQG